MSWFLLSSRQLTRSVDGMSRSFKFRLVQSNTGALAGHRTDSWQ